MNFFKTFLQKQYVKLIMGTFLVLVIPVSGLLVTNAPNIWPLSVMLYNIGLVYTFTMIPKTLIRVVAYNIVAALFFIIEASFFFSYYLQNTGFNEAFFYHIRPDLLYAGIQEHLLPIFIIIFCLSGFLILSTLILAKEKTITFRWQMLAFLFLVSGLFISPPINSLAHYMENYSPKSGKTILSEDFSELRENKIAIEFSKHKRPNIILIYAESLEQRFFDETIFPGLVPNLKKIRNQSIDFSNIYQGIGAGWTMGGIVASQCGYPLAGSHGVEDNDLSIFDRFLPKATCLGDLLKKDGYHLTFIGGADARFAGKKDFLNSHGYSEIFDLKDLMETLPDDSYLNSWGAYDDTMFDYAFGKFLTLSAEKSPFLLTLLTLDPHGPIGYLSRTCQPYGEGDNSSLNSFHCTDQLISRFIEQVRNSRYSNNTIIFVLSDHVSMRNKASSMLESSKMPERLTFFINTHDAEKMDNSNPGIHYDIAPTILDYIGYTIKGQIGFGAPLTRGPGYLTGKFGENGWKKESSRIMSISENLWDNEIFLDQRGIRFSDTNFSFTMGGMEFNLRSWGATDTPASTLFIFDADSLKMEKIKTYAFDKGLTQLTLGNELLNNKEKLTLVISRAMNLSGFTDPKNDPDRWAYFFGKPGSNYFTGQVISGDFFIPLDLIQKMGNSPIDNKVISARQDLLISLERN
ncbi:MAG: hypothetical protein AMJ61_15775 [Desulfobacterales bacterium SG8_35_2]|nr:MAG: hypothetical protein AMJ61_15775 [Desulfobacterales bacterium SG8_35_2]